MSANFNEVEWKADVWFPRKLILLSCYFKELWPHVICVWSAESVNSWVDEDDCEEAHYNDVFEIVNSVDQGNFTFVGEKVGNLKKSMTVASMWTN